MTTGLDVFSAPGIVRRRGQEAGDQGGEQARSGRQLDVAAVVDVQRRVRDACGQDAAVGHRDDRVVVAGEHQGALA
ncbi:MAG: hypothetical protein ACHQCE_23335, partial [Streptosporangiales bacterium]